MTQDRQHKRLAERLDGLGNLLSQVPAVAQLARTATEPEPQTLAYSLLEIEESCRRYLTYLEALTTGPSEEALAQLEEIREELRHILYHINDSRFLSVIS